MPAFKDRVYYVSGSASGLGLAAARSLRSKGAKTVLLDLNDVKGKEIEAEFGQDNALFCQCDVRSTEEIEAAIKATEAKWPSLKTAGVINAGGIGYMEPVVSKDGQAFDIDAFKTVIDINLVGSFNLSRLIAARIVLQNDKPKKPVSLENMAKMDPFPVSIPGAINEDRGIIIFVSSVAYQDGQNGQAAYSASKGGLAAMTLPMARDLSRYGIRVNAIAPSMFDTAMGSALPVRAKVNLLTNTVFPPRAGQPDEFAHFVIALCENSMLNGGTFRLDGATRMNKL